MATDLSALLHGGVIIPLQDASSRKQAIHVLCEALSEATGIGARAIEDAARKIQGAWIGLNHLGAL